MVVSMTQTEALRLALETLEYAGPSWIESRQPAITAIKAALEAKDEPWEKFCDSNCVWTDHHPDCRLAQRTWVDLTNKEVDTIRANALTKEWAILMAQSTLKEKNT
jgi:uncharacterized protein YecT (DUF1311 family)